MKKTLSLNFNIIIYFDKYKTQIKIKIIYIVSNIYFQFGFEYVT